MSIELITILLFGGMLVILATGLPVAFGLGGLATAFAIAFWGTDHLSILAAVAFSSITKINYLAIPLFVLMGNLMSYTGIADDLYECMYLWLGHMKGGLAVGTIIICTLFGAMSGSIAASVVTMTAIALPSMRKRGYNTDLILGTISAGAGLAFIIPPSIEMIIYSGVAGESLGRFYLGGIFPGLLLSCIYIAYILIRSQMQPTLSPAVSKEVGVSWGKRFLSLKSVIAPLMFILFILGGIYSGAITPVEASAVGAAGALISALIYKRLTWKGLKQSLEGTVKTTAMALWMLMAVGCFTSIYSGIGAPDLAKKLALALPGGAWGTMITMQVILLIAGMFMDDFAVILIFAPVFVPIIKLLGFDTLWFAIVFMINLQIALLSPPYGFTLFYMRAVVPKDITMMDIYRSAIPYALLQIFGLIVIMAIPSISLWLPNLLIKS